MSALLPLLALPLLLVDDMGDVACADAIWHEATVAVIATKARTGRPRAGSGTCSCGKGENSGLEMMCTSTKSHSWQKAQRKEGGNQTTNECGGTLQIEPSIALNDYALALSQVKKCFARHKSTSHKL